MADTETKDSKSSWLWIAVIIVCVIAWSQYHSAQDKPEVRAQVSFVSATLPNNSGYEALVKNTNNESEAVTVTVSRPSDGETKAFDYNIAENDYQEIGSSNGWAFQSGDELSVGEEGYKSLQYTVN